MGVAIGVIVCMFLFLFLVWLCCSVNVCELICLMFFVLLCVWVLDCQDRIFIIAWIIFAQGREALRTSSAVIIFDLKKSIARIIFYMMKLGLGSSSHMV